MKKTGEKDLIFGLQAAAVMNLRCDARMIRREQRRRERENLGPDKDLTEMVCNNARAITSITGEVRKSGKDMRESGRKMTREQGRAAAVAFLRSCSAEERTEAAHEIVSEAADA